MYGHLSCQELLPNELKGCRKNSRGTKDQLIIDKATLKNCERILVWSYSEEIGMKFGIDKCAVLELERGRLVRSEGIELPDGEKMKEVDQERYNYFGVLQLDKSMNKEMKENNGNVYIRRVILFFKSNLNAGNFISDMNAWAIGVMRYSGEIIDWIKEEQMFAPKK